MHIKLTLLCNLQQGTKPVQNCVSGCVCVCASAYHCDIRYSIVSVTCGNKQNKVSCSFLRHVPC